MKTIFNDPISLSRSCVGSPTVYRSMQFLTIISGILLIAYVVLLNREASFMALCPISFLLFLFVIQFPLFYLKALRAFWLKMEYNDPR